MRNPHQPSHGRFGAIIFGASLGIFAASCLVVGPVWSEERNLYFVGATPTGPVETLTLDLQDTGQPTMAAHR